MSLVVAMSKMSPIEGAQDNDNSGASLALPVRSNSRWFPNFECFQDNPIKRNFFE